MPLRWLLIPMLLLLTSPAVLAEEEPFEDRVILLMEGLGSSEPLERLAAEGALSDLAEGSLTDAERLLKLLPEPNAAMPQAVKTALERVRLRTEQSLARRATGASTVTLDVVQASLPEILNELEIQTGNRFADKREQFGGNAKNQPITLRIKDQPFWPAVDQLLDAANLSVYAYGEEGELSLIVREPTAGNRVGAAAYAGPFRFEPLSLSATRGVRAESESRLDLSVEVAWEPRLRPIAISQPMKSVAVVTDGDTRLPPRTPEQSIDLEATPGEQALTMVLSLALPDRGVKRLESVTGRLQAIIPATKREFRVAKLGEAKLPLVQEFGDATVTLERFSKPDSVWELHMRLQLAQAGDALASHRGWVFQNTSYLLKPNGERIEHAGFETTMQSDTEIGIAYLFDLSGGDIYDFDFDETAPTEDEEEEPKEIDPKTLTWVYETATGVYTVPVEWKLGPIDLP